MDSSDEALCEMLGLPSLETLGPAEGDDAVLSSVGETPDEEDVLRLSKAQIDVCLDHAKTREIYRRESICLFPQELAVPSSRIRRLTDELVWGGDTGINCDRTYETVTTVSCKRRRRTRNVHQGTPCKEEEICEHHEERDDDDDDHDDDDDGIHPIVEKSQKRVLTRLENFVSSHDGWSELCTVYLQQCISSLLGTDMTLFKEKLNLKPPGGSGFAPHCDTPSLRMPFGTTGPQNFTTVMVAIDNMTRQNGCLRVVRGRWSEDNHCPVAVPSSSDANPDGEGRAGAIVDDPGEYEDIECRSGDVIVFNGWVPHRSSANMSPFPRRAVFLTYNPTAEGDYHALYYIRMTQLRNDYKTKLRIEQQEKLEI